MINFSSPKIALLPIDLDLYSAHNITLESLFDSVVTEGIVIFDDYNDSKWLGAKKQSMNFLLIELN